MSGLGSRTTENMIWVGKKWLDDLEWRVKDAEDRCVRAEEALRVLRSAVLEGHFSVARLLAEDREEAK